MHDGKADCLDLSWQRVANINKEFAVVDGEYL